jgi:predicted O-methyltransferase YrrM
MLFSRITRQVSYLLFSRHGRGHGIHSPFAFDIVSRVFNAPTDKKAIEKIEKTRELNSRDRRMIEVNDFGTGSARMKGNARRVSEVAKFSPVPSRYGKLLMRLSGEFGAPAIFELGTSLGISSMYLASARNDVPLYTIEGCRALAEIASANFRSAGIDNVIQITGQFSAMLSEIEKLNIKPGLVFIDGDHRGESTVDYFSRIAGMSGDNSVIVIDDIHYSRGMEEAWKEIKCHERVSLTIDISRMGLVFFRKGMTSSNIRVRYL